MRPELDASGTEEGAGLGAAGVLDSATDVAEQSAEQRLVDLFVGGRQPVLPPAVLGAQDVELVVNVAPFAKTQP